MRRAEATRLVRVPLGAGPPPADAALLVRGDERPFALVGEWAGGGALAGSSPVRVAGTGDDPFTLLDDQPAVAGAIPGAVGGGWFGYLGYGLGARVERVPPPPRRPAPLPPFALAFYDHVLRLDARGRWWFEALWTDARAAELERRLELLRRRLRSPLARRPAALGELTAAAPGAAGHLEAVAACRERIAAGEIFQANLCLRLEGAWSGDAVDLFARAATALRPRYGAFVGGPWGAVASLSPELFLRRSGRTAVTEPIKGTAADRAVVARSAKDRAENVMIADLMRNDLGRVSEYGSVRVRALAEPRPGPGVWHLVSEIEGTLRSGAGDADLVRASFPPGSVTGAPKIQAMRVISELEATGREAYTGAVGYANPLAGLELNVAIRTIELSGDRAWLGVGGGIVYDSDPELELRECLLKARPVVEAAGGSVALEPPGRAPRARGASTVRPDRDAPAFALGPGRDAPAFALGADRERPDPGEGVFETLLVRDGRVHELDAHLARLARSLGELYAAELQPDLRERIHDAAGTGPDLRLRILADPNGAAHVVAIPLARAADVPFTLAPAVLPGGLGAHKWRDRRLLDALADELDAVPLLLDLDGHVLEAAHANVWVVEGSIATTPPADGRILPGTVRDLLLADPPAGVTTREEPLTLDRVRSADELLLTSSIRRVHRALLRGAPPREPTETGARLRAALARAHAVSG